MKRLISYLFFLAISTHAFAQKSYIHIYANYIGADSHSLSLTGDLPIGIKQNYYNGYDDMTIGKMLNLLSKEGYEVESMSAPAYTENNGTSYPKMCYLLSKKDTGGSNTIQTVRDEDDSDIYEVARYNLQGRPINESEKGVQIIVFSNYTTKTIIKE